MKEDNEYKTIDITVDIPSITNFIAQKLNISKFTPIREYISNAVDALKDEPNPRISVSVENNSLIIEDNGCGMTEEEIKKAYTRIGGTLKKFFENKKTTEFIGEFGVGVLTAFKVAELLEVFTKSNNDNNGWKLIWKKNEDTFQLTELNKEKGTKASLKLDLANFSELANATEVTGYIKRTFALLPIPIYWEKRKNINAYWELVADLYKEKKGRLLPFEKFKPLFKIFFQKDIEAIYYTEDDHNTKIFLAIPSKKNEIDQLRNVYNANLFSKGVLVNDQQLNFFPNNLSFMLGIIDCPKLELTANREDIFKNEEFLRIKSEIGFHVLKFFELLSNEEPKLLEKILKEHKDRLISYSYEDSEFINILKKHYFFSTNLGHRKWKDIVRNSEIENGSKVVYVISSDIEKARGENESFLIVYAPSSIEPLIKEIASSNDIILKEYHGDNVIEVAPSFMKLGIVIKQHLFNEKIHTINFFDDSSQIPCKFDLEKSQRNNDSLNKSYKIDALRLNIHHSLIRELADKNWSTKKLSNKQLKYTAKALYNIATINALIQNIVFEHHKNIMENIMENIIHSIEHTTQLEFTQPYPEDGNIYCFVAMPYKDDFKNVVYEVANEFLSSSPYHWKLKRADISNIESQSMLDNIKRQIDACQRFLIDISGLNKNVLIELGYILNKKTNSAFIICDDTTRNHEDFPEDIKGLIIPPYNSEIRKNHTEFQKWFKNIILQREDFLSLQGKN